MEVQLGLPGTEMANQASPEGRGPRYMLALGFDDIMPYQENVLPGGAAPCTRPRIREWKV